MKISAALLYGIIAASLVLTPISSLASFNEHPTGKNLSSEIFPNKEDVRVAQEDTNIMSGLSEESGELERPISWYIVRSGGIVSYLLLFLMTVLGLFMSLRIKVPKIPPYVIIQLHCWISWLTLFFVGTHTIFLLFDRFIPYTLVGLLIPFAASYKPAFTALGIVTFYSIVAIIVSTRYLKMLPRKVWRLIHQTSLIAFFCVTAHGVLMGTDTVLLPVKLMYGICGGSILFLTLWRITSSLNASPSKTP